MPAVIDTQGPLARRKALIAKLMAQLSGQSMPDGAPQMRAMPARAMPIPSGAGAMSIRPGNLEPRSAMIPGLRSAFSQVQGVNDPTPPPPAPPAQGGGEPPPAPEPAAAPAQWESEGYVSQGAYNAFNSMQPEEQARILANPVARRRYFG